MEPGRVFISHSHEDNDVTQSFVTDLQSAGVKVWVDQADLRDSDFLKRINEALQQCEWCVPILTPHALHSPYVEMEVNAAINLVRQGRMRAVIPVTLRPFNEGDLPPIWAMLHRYDAVKDYRLGISGLLKALQASNPIQSISASSSGYTDGAALNETPSPSKQKKTRPLPDKRSNGASNTLTSGWARVTSTSRDIKHSLVTDQTTPKIARRRTMIILWTSLVSSLLFAAALILVLISITATATTCIQSPSGISCAGSGFMILVTGIASWAIGSVIYIYCLTLSIIDTIERRDWIWLLWVVFFGALASLAYALQKRVSDKQRVFRPVT